MNMNIDEKNRIRMKKNRKVVRLTENIYDVMLGTPFFDYALRQLRKDIEGYNITLDAKKGLIIIETCDSSRILYEIRISKKGGKVN